MRHYMRNERRRGMRRYGVAVVIIATTAFFGRELIVRSQGDPGAIAQEIAAAIAKVSPPSSFAAEPNFPAAIQGSLRDGAREAPALAEVLGLRSGMAVADV